MHVVEPPELLGGRCSGPDSNPPCGHLTPPPVCRHRRPLRGAPRPRGRSLPALRVSACAYIHVICTRVRVRLRSPGPTTPSATACSRQSRPLGSSWTHGGLSCPPALTSPSELLPGPHLGSPHTFTCQLWRSRPQDHYENQPTARGLGHNLRENILLSSQTDSFPTIRCHGSELKCHQSLKPQAARCQGFPGGSESKESARSAGEPGSVLGSGRPPGEGNGSPLQHSCLESPMDRGAWRAAGRGVAQSRT